MKSILLIKKVLGLVEMTSGLVNASYSLPERQAVKMIFFAPCFLLVELTFLRLLRTTKLIWAKQNNHDVIVCVHSSGMWERPREGGTLGIFRWGCATGTV